ncbi:MAG: response regulator transcription factor [Thermoclostridium sp.]|nr:response regulator transcription factor [Thermoclostridium sp.]
MDKIKILLVDDQVLFYSGLKTILDLESDLQVIGTAADGREAVRLADRLRPDIILLDIRMPGMDGVMCVKAIRENHPDIKLLMLTTFNDDEYILDALANGANGYLLKDIEVGKLVEAIHDAMAGKMILPSDVAGKLAAGINKIKQVKPAAGLLELLSDRELEVARMMVQGFSNRQISSALYISEGTVRNYISVIYDKLDRHDRTQAVLYLKEIGIN